MKINDGIREFMLGNAYILIVYGARRQAGANGVYFSISMTKRVEGGLGLRMMLQNLWPQWISVGRYDWRAMMGFPISAPCTGPMN